MMYQDDEEMGPPANQAGPAPVAAPLQEQQPAPENGTDNARSMAVRHYIESSRGNKPAPKEMYEGENDDRQAVKDAQADAKWSNKVAGIGQAISGYFTAEGRALGAETDNSAYDAIRASGKQGVEQAQSNRQAQIQNYLQKRQMGREDKQDIQSDATYAESVAAKKREQDPNSPESTSARDLAMKMNPVGNYEGMSASQLKASMPQLEKIYSIEQTRLGQERASADKADLIRATIGARRGEKEDAHALKVEEKADADAKKEEDYQGQVKIPGLDVTPGYKPTVQGAAKVRDLKTTHDDMIKSLDAMDKLYAGTADAPGTGTNMVGDDSNDQSAYAESLRMKLKNLQSLGALSESDYLALDKQVPDPTSVKENIKGMFGADSYAVKSKTFRQLLENSLNNMATNSGYTVPKAAEEAPPGGKTTTAAGPKPKAMHGADLPD